MTGHERPRRQLFVVAELAEARLRMRLLPALDGGEPLAAVNGGVGIAPLEMLGHGDHGTLVRVYHVFRQLELSNAADDGDERLASAFSAWHAALARSGIDLRLERRALYGPPLRHTDWRADARGISVRPWDVELTALAAGLRRIVKLDRVPPHFVERLRETSAQRALRVEVVAPLDAVAHPGLVTLLVAREASVLAAARDVEALLLARGDTPDATAATLEMGDLLGYPRCCVERFTRIADRNDTTLTWALLPGVPHPAASPLTQWLQPALALLSHSPCDLHCAPSIALGAGLLAALEAAQAGFEAHWRSLTARVQVIDHRGSRLALAVDGRLEAGATITAADPLASGEIDPDATSRARHLVGRTVRPDSGGLVTDDDSWWAAYVADHRGRP